MSKGRRIAMRTSVLGVSAALVATLAACGSSEPDRIDYLIDAQVRTYNANSVDGNAGGAVMALARVLPGFSYLGPDGQVVADRDIGTVTQEEGASLTLRYTFNQKAVYSDGHPMVCDDLMLAATAMSGRTPGFAPATTAGYRDIARIECTPGAREAVVTFARGRDYAQWQALFGVGTLLPSHVIARKAGVNDVVGAITRNDGAALRKLGEAWTSGFALAPTEKVDPSVFLSSGPYKVTAYTVADGLQLVSNDKWWGEAPPSPEVTVWPRGTDTEKALAAGRIDVVDTGDLTVADRVMGRAPAEFSPSDNRAAAKDPRPLSVTQLVLSSKGVFANPTVRRAFASCVPRDSLARRFGANGVVWSMRTVAPADSLGSALNGQFGRRFPRADIQRTRALLAEAGGAPTEDGAEEPAAPTKGATVRIGYVAPDPAGKAVVAAIASSCQAGGITVTDASSPELEVGALGKDVDVLLTNGATGTAAAGTASGFPTAYQLFGGDPLNLPNFRNPQVSGAIADLSLTTSDSARLPLVRSIENAAWDDVASIPLYGTVRARENTGAVGGVVPGLARTGTGWNMDRWTQS